MTKKEKIIEKIIEEIKNRRKFKEVKVDEFAKAESWADLIAQSLGDKMKTTQLRKVFTSIKLMDQRTKGKLESEQFNDPDLYMLLPQMAYAKARKLIIPEFYDLIKTVINDGKIVDIGDFRRFVQFLTAIVAYHKQHSK